MYEYYPLLIVGAVIGVLSIIFILAYALMKDKKDLITPAERENPDVRSSPLSQNPFHS